MSERSKLMSELRQAVERGLRASEIAEFMSKPLCERKEEIIEAIAAGSYIPAAGKSIDYSAVIMPHLEMRLIHAIERGIESAVKTGMEAREKLSEMNNSSRPVSRLRF